MSKKTETIHASSQPNASHGDSQWAETAEFSKPTVEWLSEVHADADAFVAEEKRVVPAAAELIRAAKPLQAKIYNPKNADLRRGAWDAGLDGNFWAAADAQLQVVERHAREVPKDLRTIEVITPGEAAKVEAHAQYLIDLRSSAARYARTKNALAQLEILVFSCTAA